MNVAFCNAHQQQHKKIHLSHNNAVFKHVNIKARQVMIEICTLSCWDLSRFRERVNDPLIPPDACSVCLHSTMAAQLIGFTLVDRRAFTSSTALCIYSGALCSRYARLLFLPDVGAQHRFSTEQNGCDRKPDTDTLKHLVNFQNKTHSVNAKSYFT